MKGAPTLVTTDFTKEFNAIIKSFKKDAVLVGIPEDRGNRKDEDAGMGNAAILAINHFGSEEAHIPPRPVLTTGIKNAQEEIAQQFKLCAKEALTKGIPALEKYYNRAGSIAASSCKRVINEQEGLKAPADSTLRSRKYLTASGFKGTKALLVTGQLRNAITYVVQSVWGK